MARLYIFTTTAVVTTLFILKTTISAGQKFDPYQLNGGLVAAVAGKNYILIASDTRLTDGGYGINSRQYLSGRIWSASSSSSLSTFRSTPPSISEDRGNNEVSSTQSKTSTIQNSLKRFPAQWSSDGSLVMPSSNSIDYDITTNNMPNINQIEDTTDSLLQQHSTTQTNHHNYNLPIMIGSAGCASDCESLKRRIRLELDALEYTTSNSSGLSVSSVANLLQQVLYSRRSFPFYSFCVVAGIDYQQQQQHKQGSGSTSTGCGAVYVYDAIGSYERVAVASSGTGRELMQPILDRLFSSSNAFQTNQKITSHNTNVQKDIMAIPAGKQRVGVAGSLHPPVQTTVNCSWEESVRNVVRAYQSVAEREISVGDEIVICVVNTSSSKEKIDGDNDEVAVFRYPLKKH